jgi:hypothetical protein
MLRTSVPGNRRASCLTGPHVHGADCDLSISHRSASSMSRGCPQYVYLERKPRRRGGPAPVAGSRSRGQWHAKRGAVAQSSTWRRIQFRKSSQTARQPSPNRSVRSLATAGRPASGASVLRRLSTGAASVASVLGGGGLIIPLTEDLTDRKLRTRATPLVSVPIPLSGPAGASFAQLAASCPIQRSDSCTSSAV